MQPSNEPPEPWRSFFDDLDALLTEHVQLHCCGGFVVTQLYGVARTTNDIDFLGVVPNVESRLIDVGGKDSPLHKKHKVFLHAVTVATYPDNYEKRLAPMFPGTWRHLQLFALEAHDLALTKLERNIERDRDDVYQLARAGHLRSETLRDRYYSELRPYLANETRHDLTLQQWLEFYW